MQSLSEDPRRDVIVAGEDGYAERAAYGGGHPGGSSNNLTPAEIEAQEEDASERETDKVFGYGPKRLRIRRVLCVFHIRSNNIARLLFRPATMHLPVTLWGPFFCNL